MGPGCFTSAINIFNISSCYDFPPTMVYCKPKNDENIVKKMYRKKLKLRLPAGYRPEILNIVIEPKFIISDFELATIYASSKMLILLPPFFKKYLEKGLKPFSE